MYLVLENHYSYSLVLSEDGKFLRVANLGYEVGEMTDRVYILKENISPMKAKRGKKVFEPILALAACLVFALVGVFSSDLLGPRAYGTVYMSINPEISIDLKKDDTVISLTGLNEDGKILAEGLAYEGEKLDDLLDDIYERAAELGFLDSGRVYIKIDGKDESWEDEVMSLVKDRLVEKDLSIRIDIETNNKKEKIEPESLKKTIKIPIKSTQVPEPKDEKVNESYRAPSYDDSAYGESGTYQSPSYSEDLTDDSPYEAPSDDTTNYSYIEDPDNSAYDTDDDSSYGSSYDDSAYE